MQDLLKKSCTPSGTFHKYQYACDFHIEKSREEALNSLLGINFKQILPFSNSRSKILNKKSVTRPNSGKFSNSFCLTLNKTKSPKVIRHQFLKSVRIPQKNELNAENFIRLHSISQCSNSKNDEKGRKNYARLKSFLTVSRKPIVISGKKPCKGTNTSQQVISFDLKGKSVLQSRGSVIDVRNLHRNSNLNSKIKLDDDLEFTDISAWEN